LPLSAQAYFCDTRSPLRSRSVASRSTLRSRSTRFLLAPPHFCSAQHSRALVVTEVFDAHDVSVDIFQ